MAEQLALELPLLITVIAAIIGATANVLRGYHSDDDKNKTFEVKKFVSGLIPAVMGAVMLAATLPIADTTGGVIGLFIAGLGAGFGLDFIVSKGKK